MQGDTDKLIIGKAYRLRGGALGFEAELPPVVELRPDADRLKFRIQARDGSLSVVLDGRRYDPDTDGTVDQSTNDGTEPGEPYNVNVLEIVTAPIVAVPGDDGRANREDVLAAVDQVYRSLEQVGRGTAIDHIFPEEFFEYSPDAR